MPQLPPALGAAAGPQDCARAVQRAGQAAGGGVRPAGPSALHAGRAVRQVRGSCGLPERSGGSCAGEELRELLLKDWLPVLDRCFSTGHPRTAPGPPALRIWRPSGPSAGGFRGRLRCSNFDPGGTLASTWHLQALPPLPQVAALSMLRTPLPMRPLSRGGHRWAPHAVGHPHGVWVLQQGAAAGGEVQVLRQEAGHQRSASFRAQHSVLGGRPGMSRPAKDDAQRTAQIKRFSSKDSIQETSESGREGSHEAGCSDAIAIVLYMVQRRMQPAQLNKLCAPSVRECLCKQA